MIKAIDNLISGWLCLYPAFKLKGRQVSVILDSLTVTFLIKKPGYRF
jgi:hypothetical protein